MVGMNEERGQTLDEVFEEDETVAGDDKTHKTDPRCVKNYYFKSGHTSVCVCGCVVG